jgi:hypothetical protein
LNGTLKNKHETDVNENIILALFYKADRGRLHIKTYNVFFLEPSYREALSRILVSLSVSPARIPIK